MGSAFNFLEKVPFWNTLLNMQLSISLLIMFNVYICGRTMPQMDQTNGNGWRFNINWPAEGGGGLCCCRSGADWCQDRPAGTYHNTPPSPFLRRLACMQEHTTTIPPSTHSSFHRRGWHAMVGCAKHAWEISLCRNIPHHYTLTHSRITRGWHGVVGT